MAIRASNITCQVLYKSTGIARSVTDTILFDQEGFASGVRVANLTFQILQFGAPSGPSRHYEDELVLVDGATYFHAVWDRQVPENELELEQILFSPSHPQVIDDLELTDEVVWSGPKPLSVDTTLHIFDHAGYCFSAPWAPIEIEDDLGINDYVNFGYPISVSDTLVLTDEAYRWLGTHQIIIFEQYVSAGISYGIEHEIDFVSTLEVEGVFARGISHDDIISHAFTYYIDSGCNRKSYTRFEGYGEYTGIEESPLTFDSDFVLESLAGAKDILVLRNPETDDRQRLGFSRINRESRGGELQVYADPDWPVIHTLLFTIVALSDSSKGCPDKINDLLSFLQDHLGEEIMLHDWEGITWKGVITTPNETAVEDGESWWTISFEFEGYPMDGSPGHQIMAISDSAACNGDYVRSAESIMGLVDEVGVSGVIWESVSDDIGLDDEIGGYNEHTILSDDFSGLAGTDLDGQSPDVGASIWYAHTNYKADGSQTAINGGAYYPFVPESGKHYFIEWNATALAESAGLETWLFLGEGINSDPDDTGPTAFGRFSPTTLKAGFTLRDVGGTQLNGCKLGDATDGSADYADFSDAVLKAEADDIDLMLYLDTTDGAGLWKVTWYAKDPADPGWTEVRSEKELLDEDIAAVGWSNDNLTTTVDLDGIEITERVYV